MTKELNLPEDEYLKYQSFNELLGIYKYALLQCEWDAYNLTNPF